MALGIDYFRAIQGGIGHTNVKDVKVAEVRRQFANDFDSSIGVVYDATKNDVPQDFIITPTKEKNKCNIYTRPDEELNIGDIIFWNKLHWLVIDKDFQNDIYNTGTIVRCNRIVRWQNPVTLEIIERWCFAESSYASGIDDGKVISVPNREFRVMLPYDKETVQVDIGKRLVLETINGIQKTYRLEMPDLNTNIYQDSKCGFVVWNLKFSSDINPEKDNIELGICDYIFPDSLSPVISTTSDLLKCEIIGSDSIKIGGIARDYKPVFYEFDGTTWFVKESIRPKWKLYCVPEHEKYIMIKEIRDSISIKVMDNDILIGENVKLILTDSTQLYKPTELQIELVVN